LPGRPQRTDRRAVAAGGEPARVAVSERPRPRLEQCRRMLGHPPAALDLVAVDLARALGGISGPLGHLPERPRAVDRPGPGGREAGRVAPAAWGPSPRRAANAYP